MSNTVADFFKRPFSAALDSLQGKVVFHGNLLQAFPSCLVLNQYQFLFIRQHVGLNDRDRPAGGHTAEHSANGKGLFIHGGFTARYFFFARFTWGRFGFFGFFGCLAPLMWT